MRHCEECDFFDDKHYSLSDFETLVPNWEEWGYCIKHKPVTLSRQNKCFGDWPAVHKLRGCAEFRLRPEKENKNGLS
jgi:hypothetical protein